MKLHATDMEPKALYILKMLQKNLHLKMDSERKLQIEYNKIHVQTLAADLFEVYIDGVNDWIGVKK